jgi:hypothetical protein
MYDILKEIADNNGWGFFYGRRDFQNLQNEVENTRKIYCFLDPVIIDHNYNEYGELESSTHSGTMMMVKSSPLDEDYEDKYRERIMLMKSYELIRLTDALSCNDITINNFRTTEVINLFDYGYDGLIINYSITL